MPVLPTVLVSLEVVGAHGLVIVVPVQALLGTISLLKAGIDVHIADLSGAGVHRLAVTMGVQKTRTRPTGHTLALAVL